MSADLIIYILCGVIVFLVVEIIALIILYRRKQTAPDRHERDSHKAAERIVDHANKKAEMIIQNAVDKAEQIIYDSQEFKDKINKELTFSYKDAATQQNIQLEQILEKLLRDYQETFTITKQAFLEKSNKTIDKVKEYAEMEFAMVKDQSAAKVAVMEEYIRNKIDLEFQEAKKEIDKWKEVEKNRTSQMIKEAITELSNEVLHLSIPKSEQERLIMEALDKARKDNIFSI